MRKLLLLPLGVGMLHVLPEADDEQDAGTLTLDMSSVISTVKKFATKIKAETKRFFKKDAVAQLSKFSDELLSCVDIENVDAAGSGFVNTEVSEFSHKLKVSLH